MAGISDIIANVSTTVGAISGLVQSDERVDIRFDPTTRGDGYFQIRLDESRHLEYYGDKNIKLFADIIIDIAYRRNMTFETKFKSIGTNRESVITDLLDPSTWDSGTTGLTKIDLVNVRIDESVENFWIDTFYFTVEYIISWI